MKTLQFNLLNSFFILKFFFLFTLTIIFSSGKIDFLDIETGIFTYYGDNRTPGYSLLNTSKKGNKCLENLFNWTHVGGDKRKKIPPIFVFIKEGKKGRDYRFRGLVVPGNPIFSQTEDLVSVWKSTAGVATSSRRGLARLGLAKAGLATPVHARPCQALAWPCQAWPGLAYPGLPQPGLTWPG